MGFRDKRFCFTCEKLLRDGNVSRIETTIVDQKLGKFRNFVGKIHLRLSVSLNKRRMLKVSGCSRSMTTVTEKSLVKG